jgi:hypothetical protein
MANLKMASRELFRRQPDDSFPSIPSLSEHCHRQKQRSQEAWLPPASLSPSSLGDAAVLTFEQAGKGIPLRLNDWSFGQLCRFAKVGKETINRLTSETAARVFAETLPKGQKPWQLLVEGNRVRSVHAASYSRLYNVDLLSVVREFAVDFQPPPKGVNGGTGLYAGEQDMFCFLIDPTGWAEIQGEAFAPGFFVWNSEVGRRTVGISTFWFQAVCGNHIVWDAVEVTEFTRKHTGNIYEALSGVRRILESLVAKRDERRDGFVRVIEKAMTNRFGDDTDDALKLLRKQGSGKKLASRAVELAQQQGGLTIFSVVDALTRLSQEQANAGDRLTVDHQAAHLLTEATMS